MIGAHMSCALLEHPKWHPNCQIRALCSFFSLYCIVCILLYCNYGIVIGLLELIKYYLFSLNAFTHNPHLNIGFMNPVAEVTFGVAFAFIMPVLNCSALILASSKTVESGLPTV